MEELILVTGCTLVSSWAAAVSVDNNVEAGISLASRAPGNDGARFVWSKIRGPVVHHNSSYDPVRSSGYIHLGFTDLIFFWLHGKQYPFATPDRCVFIRGFRAKGVLFRDNRGEGEIQLIRVPYVRSVGM